MVYLVMKCAKNEGNVFITVSTVLDRVDTVIKIFSSRHGNTYLEYSIAKQQQYLNSTALIFFSIFFEQY